jgi:hypothetical protein
MFVGTRYMTIINSGRTTRRFVGHAKDVIIVKLLVVEGEKCRAPSQLRCYPHLGGGISEPGQHDCLIGRGGKCRYVLLLFYCRVFAR